MELKAPNEMDSGALGKVGAAQVRAEEGESADVNKYSKKERAQLAHAFKMALPRLANSYSIFDIGRTHICYAINDAAEFGDITHEAAKMAKKVVTLRLGRDVSSLISWLEKSGFVGEGKLFADLYKNNYRKVQATRKAWLESLVEEFGGVLT